MDKIWLQIKAFYTNIPSSTKIIIFGLLYQLVSHLATDFALSSFYIHLNPFYQETISVLIGLILNAITHAKLRFSNVDVLRAEASTTMVIDVEKTTPSNISIT